MFGEPWLIVTQLFTIVRDSICFLSIPYTFSFSANKLNSTDFCSSNTRHIRGDPTFLKFSLSILKEERMPRGSDISTSFLSMTLSPQVSASFWRVTKCGSAVGCRRPASTRASLLAPSTLCPVVWIIGKGGLHKMMPETFLLWSVQGTPSWGGMSPPLRFRTL